MKKVLVFAVAMLLVAAGAALASVVGTKHDLHTYASIGGTADGTGEVCVACHTPHGGDTTALGSDTTINSGNILWNRGNVPTAYNNGSNTCMSCHDGTLDETMLNAPGSGGANASATYAAGAWANSGLTALESGGAYKASSHPIGVPIPSTGDWKAVGAKGDTVVGTVGGNVECVSCHEPHRAVFASGAVAYLRVSNNASAVCTACHDK